jgi:predicted RNase H-like nuclease (RuvC/YqgF family)
MNRRADKLQVKKLKTQLNDAYTRIDELETQVDALNRDKQELATGKVIHDAALTWESKIEILKQRIEREKNRADVFKKSLDQYRFMSFWQRFCFLFQGGEAE